MLSHSYLDTNPHKGEVRVPVAGDALREGYWGVVTLGLEPRGDAQADASVLPVPCHVGFIVISWGSCVVR